MKPAVFDGFIRACRQNFPWHGFTLGGDFLVSTIWPENIMQLLHASKKGGDNTQYDGYLTKSCQIYNRDTG